MPLATVPAALTQCIRVCVFFWLAFFVQPFYGDGVAPMNGLHLCSYALCARDFVRTDDSDGRKSRAANKISARESVEAARNTYNIQVTELCLFEPYPKEATRVIGLRKRAELARAVSGEGYLMAFYLRLLVAVELQ